jgi:hypothetical protein
MPRPPSVVSSSDRASPKGLALAPVPKSVALRPRKRCNRSSRRWKARTWCSSPPAWAAAPAPARPRHRRRAREKGILTVGVVTKPFTSRATRRMQLAEAGIEELQKQVDTLIDHPEPEPVPHRQPQHDLQADAFLMADEVLHSGRARHHRPDGHAWPHQPRLRRRAHRNGEMGKAMMGTGEAEGENRALPPPRRRSPTRCSTACR